MHVLLKTLRNIYIHDIDIDLIFESKDILVDSIAIVTHTWPSVNVMINKCFMCYYVRIICNKSEISHNNNLLTLSIAVFNVVPLFSGGIKESGGRFYIDTFSKFYTIFSEIPKELIFQENFKNFLPFSENF